MSKSKGHALCGAIIGLTAIYAIARGDVAVAAPMFFVAIMFARWAHREWKRETA